MPVPIEFMPFFESLVDKSRKSEVNWEATGRPKEYRVRFADFAILVSEEGDKPMSIRIQLLNDRAEATAVMLIDDRDEEWLGAVGLFNSADRKVRKMGRTMRRAMEELGRQGAIGMEAAGR